MNKQSPKSQKKNITKKTSWGSNQSKYKQCICIVCKKKFGKILNNYDPMKHLRCDECMEIFRCINEMLGVQERIVNEYKSIVNTKNYQLFEKETKIKSLHDNSIKMCSCFLKNGHVSSPKLMDRYFNIMLNTNICLKIDYTNLCNEIQNLKTDTLVEKINNSSSPTQTISPKNRFNHDKQKNKQVFENGEYEVLNNVNGNANVPHMQRKKLNSDSDSLFYYDPVYMFLFASRAS